MGEPGGEMAATGSGDRAATLMDDMANEPRQVFRSSAPDADGEEAHR